MNLKREEFFGRSRGKRDVNRPTLAHFSCCILIIGLHLILLGSGRLNRAENFILDYFFRQRPALAVHPDILLIEIDKESIDAIGAWPWPASYHLQLIGLLKKWQAKAIIFDTLLKEKTVLSDQKENPAQVFNKKDPVYLSVALELKPAKKFYVHSLPVVLEPEGERKKWFHSDSRYENLARAIGHNVLTPDPDGVLRRVKAHLGEGGERHPYLALTLLESETGLKSKPLPSDADGNLLINWAGRWRDVFERHSYADLIRSLQAENLGRPNVVHPSDIQNKICIIGPTAPQQANPRLTPLEAGVPATAVLAYTMNNLLQSNVLKPANIEINALCLSLIGFFASLLFAVFRTARSFLFALLLGAAWVLVSFILFWQESVWVITVQPLLLILVLFIFSSLFAQLQSAKEQKDLFDLATRDGLTGLYVIRHFREILNQLVLEARQKKEPLSVLLIDLDNFKTINDTYGHPAGDMVLKKTAQVIQKCFRTKREFSKVDFGARYGGEEFIVVLRKTTLKDAAFKVAERIRKAIAETVYDWEDKVIPVTASLGVSTLHANENFPDPMVRRADEALYRAKHAGKNQVCIETFASI